MAFPEQEPNEYNKQRNVIKIIFSSVAFLFRDMINLKDEVEDDALETLLKKEKKKNPGEVEIYNELENKLGDITATVSEQEALKGSNERALGGEERQK